MRELPKLEFDLEPGVRIIPPSPEYVAQVRRAQNADYAYDATHFPAPQPVAHPYDMFGLGLFTLALVGGILWLFGAV